MADYSAMAGDYARRAAGTGTDSIAFRALTDRILSRGTRGHALDAGCGAGRSTRFLRGLGFEAIGLDISQPMLDEAMRLDPSGTYHRYASGDLFPFEDCAFDVVLSTWAVPEIATRSLLNAFIDQVARVLRPGGVAFIVSNTPEFYSHRWVSCDVDFPENRGVLASGQRVTARLMPEGVVVRDYFWPATDIIGAYESARLTVRNVLTPTASPHESGWRDEAKIAPYAIYEGEK